MMMVPASRHIPHPASQGRPQQRGAALLIAMLIVVLVAVLAAATTYRQSQILETEVAERDRAQAVWLINGMMDWARIILREDADDVDSEADTWARPINEFKLSRFLIMDKSDSASLADEDITQAYASAYLIDLNRKINLGNLINYREKTLDVEYEKIFKRLMTRLAIPQAEQDALIKAYLDSVQNLPTGGNLDLDTSYGDRPQINSEGKPYPLHPNFQQQLLWLGAKAETINAIAPYIYVLPPRDNNRPGINLNTADAIVLCAVIEGCDETLAERMISERPDDGYKSVADFAAKYPKFTDAILRSQLSVNSNFFEGFVKLRLESIVVEEKAIFYRGGPRKVLVYSREHSYGGNFKSDAPATTLEDLGIKR